MRRKQVHPSLTDIVLNASKVAFETAIGQLYIDVGQEYQERVFVAGSGRSGTTWLAELINFDNSYRLIFEPLRIRPLYKPFAGRRYLRPDDDDPILVDLMQLAVKGRLRNVLSDRYNRQPFPRKLLIKDVASNLLLGWFHRHFPEIPLVLLIRHPCAVVNSRLRLGWPYGLKCFLKQQDLMSDYLASFKTDMEKAATPFEKHLFYWCIETLVPLRQFKPGEIHLAFFEDFCVQPREEVARLFTFLGKPLDARVFDVMQRPSTQMWRRKHKLPSRTALVNGWRKHVSDQQLRLAQDLLRRFGLDSLYRPNGLPDARAASTLFAG